MLVQVYHKLIHQKSEQFTPFDKTFQNLWIIWLAFSVEFAVKSFEGNFLFTQFCFAKRRANSCLLIMLFLFCHSGTFRGAFGHSKTLYILSLSAFLMIFGAL